MNSLKKTSLQDWCAAPDSLLSPVYASLLRWDEGCRTDGLVRAGYRRFCEKRGLSLLEGPDNADLLGLAALLGPEDVGKILSSPRIAWRILQEGFSLSVDGPEIAEAFIAEAILKGIGIPVDRTLFSARCDYIITPGKPPLKISRSAGPATVSIEVTETRNRPASKGNALNALFHNSVEQDTAVAMIRDGLEVLKEVVPEAYNFVSEMMDILVLKKREGTSHFETGTFSGYAGLALFTNTHKASIREVMEGLVHEAVHCMLYMHEAADGGFLSDSNIEDRLLASPWTGANIRLQSFVHACFVWYAVHNLWTSCALQDWEKARSSERAAFAKRGFALKPVSSTLMKYSAVLRPGILHSLEDIEDRMLGYRHRP